MVLSSAARYEKSSMSDDQIAELVSNILAAVGLKVLFWIAIHVNDAFETVRFFIYMAEPIFLAYLLKQNPQLSELYCKASSTKSLLFLHHR